MNEENKPAIGISPGAPSAGTPPTEIDAENHPVRSSDIKEDDTRHMTRQDFEMVKLYQNLPVAVIAGIVAGIVCAAVWAGIAVITSTVHSYIAILVGLGVGFAVRKAGKAVEIKFGITAAVIAVLSCALGIFLATIGFTASEMGMNFFEVLINFDYSFLPEIIKADFEPVDTLFYTLAILSAFGVGYEKVKIED